MEQIPFLQMFPCCEEVRDFAGGLEKAKVTSAVLKKESMSLGIYAYFEQKPALSDLHRIEQCIADDFGFGTVSISADYPRKIELKEPTEKKSGEQVIYGKAIKNDPTPIRDVKPDDMRVTIRGKVFGVDNREVPRIGANILQFDITDGTGSLRVSKFFAKQDDVSFFDKISDGMWLKISGGMKFNTFDKEAQLEPRHIQTTSGDTVRPDAAEVKRVELHAHTRFSTLDALTDPKAYVKRAKAWGMDALAVTDHGIVQAFPEFVSAAKKEGLKAILGMEGYFINDVDEYAICRGEGDANLDDEYCVFDIETTGLSDRNDRITEIGAVILKNGQVIGDFQTFVNPEMPIPPQIQKLTGITDRDVFDAPSQAEAVGKFLDFAGGRPFCAHNADFDIGFILAAAERMGREFSPLYCDTMTLAQAIVPELKKYKLDVVAEYIGIPPFQHHRAVDDARVCARLLEYFIRKLKEENINTLRQANDYCAARPHGGRVQRPRHISILVKDRAGLKNLYTLVSKSHLDHFKKRPIIPKSLLMQYREGLIIGAACEAGEFFQAIVRKRSEAELCRIASFYDYLEIQPLANNRFMLSNGQVETDEDLRNFNRRVVEIGERMNIPVAATCDMHFLDPEDEIYRRILLTSQNYSDADQDMPLYFRTTDEMLEEFSYLGEEKAYEVVVKNTRAISDQIEGQVALLPELHLYPPVIENSDGQLKDLVYNRLHELYGDKPAKIITDRVEKEMNTILSRHFDVIYMSAQKLVADSNAHGYLVGSRGSVGSSLVAFLSGITEVNSLPAHYLCPKCYYTDFESGKGFGCGADMPDKMCPNCGLEMNKEGFDIPFETFLGIKGDKVPDIDLNFSGEYQAKAHEYTKTLFGADHVFKAGTVGTIAEKTARGYVLNYAEKKGISFTSAELNRLSLGLVGVKRTTGQHPGGLVIVPQDMDVTDFCPVQHPADDPDSGIITTHLEYHFMEDYLLKLDELGHDNPTMINMLENMTGTDAKKIRMDDPSTMSLFKSPEALGLPSDDPIIGQTGSIGIPEFGTSFTRKMLVDTQPDKFDMLVRLSGYSHGTGVWLGNAQDLIRDKIATVSETIGCRDDIMLYLTSIGMDPGSAFSTMETVRKKNKFLSEAQITAMKDLGVPDWYIESCQKIDYLFPKAHAVAYVLMGFRIAWYKVHYPQAFYSALFYRRSQKDAFDALMMTQGLRKVKETIKEINGKAKPSQKEQELLVTLEMVYEFYMRGFDFAPIDLYESDPYKFKLVGDKKLRVPFVAVAGLGSTAAEDIARVSSSGRRFISVEEMAMACPKVSQTHFEMLKELGAFGDMPEESQMSLF